jgi:hypothetical protein
MAIDAVMKEKNFRYIILGFLVLGFLSSMVPHADRKHGPDFLAASAGDSTIERAIRWRLKNDFRSK